MNFSLLDGDPLSTCTCMYLVYMFLYEKPDPDIKYFYILFVSHIFQISFHPRHSNRLSLRRTNLNTCTSFTESATGAVTRYAIIIKAYKVLSQ